MTTIQKMFSCNPTCERKRFANVILLAVGCLAALLIVTIHVTNGPAITTSNHGFYASPAPAETSAKEVTPATKMP